MARRSIPPVLKLVAASSLGLVVFFLPLPLGSRTTIPLDHLLTALAGHWPRAVRWYALAVLAWGALGGLAGQSRGRPSFFALLKTLGLAAAALYFFAVGPDWLMEPGMGPFLFEKLVVPVGLIVPLGAVFLAFLVDYGLLELVGALIEPVMRALWKTPGRSALDALASFVGSYSVGLLITDRMYLEGKYTAREAAIIATGFSTVSVTFMLVVARTLDLSGEWNRYFWSTLLVTFLVTAVTVRLEPLCSMEDAGGKRESAQAAEKGGRLARAWRVGLEAAAAAPSLAQNVPSHLAEGFRMASEILPSIMSVGLAGLVLARSTPFFDWLAWLFWPLARGLGLPQARLIAKAAALGVAEMFLPALVAAGAPAAARFVVGVVSVASILFFSASIPCILSTRIPLRPAQLVLIWLERTLLALLFAGVLARLFY